MKPTPSALSVTIITLNEEQNIAKSIRSVQGLAAEVIVVDSGSTDKTVEIAKSLGAKVIFKEWQGYGAQKNFAQSQASLPWILNLDADEWITENLAEEIRQTLASADKGSSHERCFAIPRKTYFVGKWIRHGGWFPNFVTRLGHKEFIHWTQPHVHERLESKTQIGRLRTPIEHNAFPTLADQIRTNLRYAEYGAQDLINRGNMPSLFLLLLKPPGKFIETYFLKKGFLDGLRGFLISINAAHSMFLKYAFVFEKKKLTK